MIVKLSDLCCFLTGKSFWKAMYKHTYTHEDNLTARWKDIVEFTIRCFPIQND